MTHASRDTTTGAIFESETKGIAKGIEISKYELYRFLDKKGIKWQEFLSRKLLPDEAYWDENTKTLSIFEKSSSKVKVLLMKNLRLVHLKFGSFLKLAGHLALKKLHILIF